jgi:LmbE family N-acetylglucosaminyl deacetylase
MHGTDKPDTWIDITATIDLKVQALKAHASQLFTGEVDQWLRGWGEEDGKAAGLKYAEAYRVMVLKEDEATQVQEG